MAPPDCLPDFFASGPPTPRSWSNALLTLLGVLATCGLVGTSVVDWIDAPVNTKVELAAVAGAARVLKLRCTNAPGCQVAGVFDSTGCAASAFAAKAMAGGSELEVNICASDEWGDGIRIGATLGAAVGASPIEFMSTDGQWAGLPRAPTVADVSASGGKGSVVELSSTTMIKLDATEAQSYRAGPATAGQFQCPTGMTVPTLNPLALCYHLRLDPVETKLTEKRALTFMGLLTTWGGAFSLVFGLIGTTMYWLKRVIWASSRASEVIADMKA